MQTLKFQKVSKYGKLLNYEEEHQKIPFKFINTHFTDILTNFRNKGSIF